LISGAAIVFSDLEKGTRAVELRSRLQDLRPLPWCARYEILKGMDVMEDTDLLEEDAYTAVVKRSPYVRGASSVVEVSEEGLSMKMVAEPDGQDYGWICYEAAPAKGELRWQVKAENFTGATLIGMTTNAQDLDHVPGRQREGVHVEYRRSGNVRFYADPASDQPVYYFKHAEIQSGDVVEFALDTDKGKVHIRKDGVAVCDFTHSDETPIRDLVWHPCVTLDEVGEHATVSFMS
jgi:bifunctional DNA-binding transcriptional regulator/antitoxin component of YhaV-PrlF toxin-antitoxin module